MARRSDFIGGVAAYREISGVGAVVSHNGGVSAKISGERRRDWRGAEKRRRHRQRNVAYRQQASSA